MSDKEFKDFKVINTLNGVELPSYMETEQGEIVLVHHLFYDFNGILKVCYSNKKGMTYSNGGPEYIKGKKEHKKKFVGIQELWGKAFKVRDEESWASIKEYVKRVDDSDKDYYLFSSGEWMNEDDLVDFFEGYSDFPNGELKSFFIEVFE